AEELVEAHQRCSVAGACLVRLPGVLLGEELGDRPALLDALGPNDLLKEQLMVVVHLRPAPPSWCLHRGRPTPSGILPTRQTLRFGTRVGWIQGKSRGPLPLPRIWSDCDRSRQE